MPSEPAPPRWVLPDLSALPAGQEFVAVGADLSPGMLLAGYRSGMFAMPEGAELGWWSPDPRGVLPPGRVHVARSLRRAMRRYEVSVDAAFGEVVAACADPRRAHGWISTAYRDSYVELHQLGWAHSIEVWDAEGRLAGGLFGVEVGGLFAAESKFHVRADASKVAVVALADLLAADAQARRIIDVQWCTEHLATLGAIEVPRSTYLRALPHVLACRPALGDRGALADQARRVDQAGSGERSEVGEPPTRIRWRKA